jgi:VanZ family protein
MGMIFYMSSQKSIAVTTNVVADFITFKTLHMVEYAFLFFLLYRAFHSLSHLPKMFYSLSALSIAMLYSITDELHQLSIPSRNGRLRDILFDLAGMLIMYGIIKKVRQSRKLL